MYSTFRCAPARAPPPNNGDHQAQPAQVGPRPLRRTSTANSLPPPEDESVSRDKNQTAEDDFPVVVCTGKDKVDNSKITMNFFDLGGPLRCCTCSKVVKSAAVHIRNHHSKVCFKCENCPSMVLKTQEAFDAHIMDRHPWKVRRIYNSATPPPAPEEIKRPPNKRQKRAADPMPRVEQPRYGHGDYYRSHTFDGASTPPAIQTYSPVPALGPVFNPGRTPPMLFFRNFIAFTKDLSIRDRVAVYVRSVLPLFEFTRSEGIFASNELIEAHECLENVGIGLQLDFTCETLRDLLGQ